MATADSKAPEEDIKKMEEVENENENPTLAKDDCDGASADEKKDVDEKMDVEKEISARTGFTSEEFKVELNGLPRFFGIGQAKKLFRSKGVDFHKIKPVGKQATYMFVNFKNEEEREKAIAIMDGLLVKGRKIKAFKAKAAKDPMLRKHEDRANNDKSREEDTRPIKERLISAVCPLAEQPYEKQLETKHKEVTDLMDTLKKNVINNLKFLKNTGDLLGWNSLAQVEEFVKSPVIDGYRNKCEFSVGLHPETQEVTVGFRLASYKKGSVAVVGAEDLPIVSNKMKQVTKHFETFVRSSGLPPFNNVSQVGYWKQLTVRTSRSGDCLAWIILHPQSMTDAEKEELKEKLKAHFEAFKYDGGDCDDKGVSSLHVQFFVRKEKGQEDPPVELISGTPHITETLFENLSFNVSPQAFFQINSAAAEVLYSTAGDIAGLSPDSVLLDVCCGTGTIGLSLAKRCKQVLGVELVEDAVVNANKNAERNEIKNAKFIAGRAEYTLSDMFKDCGDSHTVAIVDPPRAGLHPKAITALRASKIKNLVFISCDAKAAMPNFVSLARPTSNAFPGDPFVPRRVIPVDLFPHTKHFELVLLFERFPMSELI